MQTIRLLLSLFCILFCLAACSGPRLDCSSEAAFNTSSDKLLKAVENKSKAEQEAFMAGLAKLKVQVAIHPEETLGQCHGWAVADTVAYGKKE